MATIDKDFKVKNGLVVALGGSFGGPVEVGTPTLNAHAATKEYVDSLSGSMLVGNAAPASPTNGDQWFDTTSGTLYIYYNDGTRSQWIGVSGPSGADGVDGADGAGRRSQRAGGRAGVARTVARLARAAPLAHAGGAARLRGFARAAARRLCARACAGAGRPEPGPPGRGMHPLPIQKIGLVVFRLHGSCTTIWVGWFLMKIF